MEIHPPKPAVYLSRYSKSNNLNTELFNRGPVIVLKIDASGLDQDEIYPDDFLYDLVIEGELFETARSITTALKCPLSQAKIVLDQIETADTKSLPLVMQQFWRWYLKWPRGGEIAYTADIPPSMIIDVQPY